MVGHHKGSNGTNLVSVFQLEAADDLSFQLCVITGLVQHRLAKLWDVSAACFPQDWIQPEVCGGQKGEHIFKLELVSYNRPEMSGFVKCLLIDK